MRRVYPGFVQLAGFMWINLNRHVGAHIGMFNHLIKRGDDNSAESHRRFYDEYLAVMDLTAEFYLQTIQVVFQEHQLPRGIWTSRGRKGIPAELISQTGADDGGRRTRRYFRRRPDQGGAGPDARQVPVRSQSALRAARRRPLRHFQRPQMARADHARVRQFIRENDAA